jgi:hypothetical protein
MKTATGMLALACLASVTAIACGDSASDSGGASTGGSSAGGSGAGGAACVVDEGYMPAIDPAEFVSVIDNELFPLTPGTTFTYAEGESIVVTVVVTEDTRVVMGVTCVVVRDTAREGDVVVEDTYDWYAQDAEGNVWYFGEDTTEYEDGVAKSSFGSWEAGIDGAQPGIVMPAEPALGAGPYRQEYYACAAEDFGEVIGVDEGVTVPFGPFTDCIKTRDTTPLDPAVDENKYYCPGVGLVLAVDVPTGEREELTTVVEP